MVAVAGNFTDSRNQASPGLGYDGVVRVSVAGHYGTGVLLAGGHVILTAAHLFSSGSTVARFQFETAAGKETFSASKVVVSPDYDAANENHDLALVWLTGSAPVAADRYTLYRKSDEIGQSFTFAGYGTPGTGALGTTGQTGSTLRLAASNTFDADAKALRDRFGNSMSWSPAKNIQLVADFDNGNTARDALGQFLDVTHLGLGVSEGLTSSGDSGGPAFIDGKVAGIASYTANLALGNIHPDIDATENSSFGELAFWQRVSAQQQWIDQSLRANYTGAPTKASEVQKSVVEGNSGTVTVWFLVTLSKPAQGGELIQFHTRDGTAKAGVDYVSVSDTLKFYAGEDHVAIPVEVISNTRIDGDRSFSLVVSDPVGGVFPGGVATLTATRTILDDDGPVKVVGVAETSHAAS